MSKEKLDYSKDNMNFHVQALPYSLQNNNLLAGLIKKYNSMQFYSPKNYNDNRLLLYTLEAIEVMRYVLNQNEHSLDEKAFIILNWQILGASQEQLSMSFTAKHSALAELSFAEKIGKGKCTWFDRFPIAHSLTLEELIDNWPKKLEYIKEGCGRLEEVILNIYKKTKCISKADLSLLMQHQDIKLFSAKIDDKFLLTYEPIDINPSFLPLLNIQKIIEQMEPIFTNISQNDFNKSLTLQTLALLVEQIIGNNIKEYRKNGNVDDLLNKFAFTRNIIAHSKSLGNLVNSPDIIYSNLKECFLLQGKIMILLKDYKIEPLIKNLSNNTPKNKPLTAENSSKQAKFIGKSVPSKVTNINKNKKIAFQAEKIRQDEHFLEQEFHKSLESNKLNNLKLKEENIALHNLFLAILKNEVDKVKEYLKNYKDNINQNIKFTLKKSRINHKINSKLLVYVEEIDEKMGESIGEIFFSVEVDPSVSLVEKIIYFTPLALAIRVIDSPQNLEICNLLKQYKPNPNILIIDEYGTLHPILHEAINMNSKEKTRLLLELGANPDSIGYEGFTALSWAIIKYPTNNEMEEIIDNLIEYGVHIDFKPHFDFLKYGQRMIKFININHLQLCNELHKDANIAFKLIKTALSQGGLYYSYNIISNLYRIIQESNNIINNRSSLNPLSEKIDNPTMQKLGKLIANIMQIGMDDNIPNKGLYIYILENQHEKIRDFFKNRPPNEICKIFSNKIEITVSKHFDGFNALNLANELQNFPIVIFLKEIYSDALKAISQPQANYQDKIKNERAQAFNLQTR